MDGQYLDTMFKVELDFFLLQFTVYSYFIARLFPLLNHFDVCIFLHASETLKGLKSTVQCDGFIS